MKKLLVASTALVAFAAVNSAQAADPIKLSVGGFMTQYVGFADVDETGTQNYADVQTVADTELYFRGSTKLDNGLTIAVTVDVEGDRGNNGQDDVFMAISSDTLGTLEVGSTKSPVYDIANAAPVGGTGLSDGDWYSFTSYSAGNGDVYLDSRNNLYSDGNKVNYISPNIAGFQLVASYGLHDVNQAFADTGTNGHDYQASTGLAYSGEMGGVSIDANVGYYKAFAGGSAAQATTDDDQEIVQAGLNIGFAGFTVGGSYGEIENLDFAPNEDHEAWDFGVSYATGPYTISAGYGEAELDKVAANTDEEVKTFAAAVDYDMGAGVSTSLTIFDAEETIGTTSTDAFGIIAGISASF